MKSDTTKLAPTIWQYTDGWGTYFTDDSREWMDAVGIESVTPLYDKATLLDHVSQIIGHEQAQQLLIQLR